MFKMDFYLMNTKNTFAIEETLSINFDDITKQIKSYHVDSLNVTRANLQSFALITFDQCFFGKGRLLRGDSNHLRLN